MKIRILPLALAFLTLAGCSDDDEVVKPGVPEEPGTEIPVGTGQSDDLTIEGKITEETDQGYKAEGTLLIESGDQKAQVVSGTFTVVTDDNGEVLSMEGVGAAQMPDIGHFKSFIPEQAKETSFIYNTGKYFKDLKDEFKALPLRDTSYYFFFNILNLSPGEEMDWKVKNAGLGMTSFFINLHFEEIIVPTGSLSFELPTGTTKIGDDLAIGISGKGSFSFSPTVYTDSALNAVIDEKKAFGELQGMLYLSGEMAFTKNLPYNLSGTLVVDADFDDLFENGLSGSESDIAMNGKLLFGHDIIDLLPVDLETELVNVTLRIKSGGIGNPAAKGKVAFAGEFDDDAWVGTLLEELAGKTVADNFPRSGNEGSMFVSFGDDSDDFAMYVRAEFGMKIPGIGERELHKGIFYITSDEIQVSGGLGLPFIPGNLYATGKIGFDGKVHLTGSAIGDLKINDDIKFYSNLTVDIYNDSVALKGKIDVPYEIGKVDIKGRIGSEGLTFKGKVNTQFRKGNINLPLTNLEITGGDNKVALKGDLRLNPQIPIAQVNGEIGSDGFFLNGSLNLSKMAFGQGQGRADIPVLGMNFTASSKKGVTFDGQLNLPHGIATARVLGKMTTSTDVYGYPEMTFMAVFNSAPTISFKGLSFPSTSFSMNLSTVTGVAFHGSITIPADIGKASVSGRIQGNDISFEGNFGAKVTLAKKSLSADMSVAVSSSGVRVYGFGQDFYPVKVSGEVYTPIGIDLDVVGVVDTNGKAATYGNLSVKKDIGPLKPRGTLQFAFEGSIGIYFYGEICVDVISDYCVSQDFTLTTNWDGITNEELCLLNQCISIKDIYNAVTPD